MRNTLSVEDEFDSGTLHRLIKLKDKFKNKRLSARKGAYFVKPLLGRIEVDLEIPEGYLFVDDPFGPV